MTVSGDSTVVAPNDTAKLSFRVTTRAKQAANALDRNAARMRSVIAAIKARGIPARDIETQNVSLSRVRIRIGKHRHRHVYRATNGIRVTVHQISRTGAVIRAAVDAGATSVSGLELSSSKTDDLFRQALGRAFDEARANAQELADHAGATLGDAITITEGAPDVESCCANQQNATSGGNTPIQPGTTTVFAEVTVTFALE